MDVTAAEGAARVEGQKAQLRMSPETKPVNRATSAGRMDKSVRFEPREEREIEGDD